MANIATLTVEMLVKNDKLRVGLRNNSKQVESWAKRIQRRTNQVRKGFALVSAVGITAMGAIYAESAKTADQLAKLSDRIGEMPEKLTALQHAAELNGASTQVMNKSLEQMSKRIGEAIKGTGEAKDYLDRLGLSTQAFYSLSPAEQFKTIAESVSGLATQQEKAAAANAIFGRSGIELINTLDVGREGLNAMETEARQLGLTLSRVELAKVEAANDAFHRAKETSKGFGRSLSVELAPYITAVSERFVEAAKEAGGFERISQKMVQVTAFAVGKLADGVHALKIVWQGVHAASAQAIKAITSGIAWIDTAISKLLNKIPGVEAEQSAFLQRIKTLYAESADETAQVFQASLLEPLPSKKIKEWMDDANEKAQEAAEKIAEDRAPTIGVKLTNSPLSSDNDSDTIERLKRENERILSLTQARFQRIHEQSLQAEGRTLELEKLRYQRQQQALQEDLLRLQNAGLLTAEVKAQFRQADEQAESIHQSKLTTIKQQALAHEIKINQAKAQLVSEVAGLGQSLVDSDSKTYKRLAKIQKTAAVFQAGLELQKAISQANAVQWPANIPEIIRATSIGAGALANIKSLKEPSFMGGGYTGDGPRTGGVDGYGGFPAILHPRETVIDHTKTSVAGLTVVINHAPLGTEVNYDRAREQLIIDCAVRQSESNFIDQVINGGRQFDALAGVTGMQRVNMR
ncbi:MAG: hypothetical protein KTR20_12860 [Cellvibrionaceae bacterium]|nr:hypothetical protein [Cellvibrionaceae bacterium]